jgi:hypothetical protein
MNPFVRGFLPKFMCSDLLAGTVNKIELEKYVDGRKQFV